jgi:hypothetical protein
MAFRDVRLREMRNRLVFRYDPDHDVIAIVVQGVLVEINLDDYRPPHQRRKGTGVDFRRIDGEEGLDG